ncbi:pre-mRNA 3' end processing protein WDR33 [Smittium culicis]|uniref:Polyadenylation factor subunit 2 n=1 Tax=Smittium culicis TaxID=133412 RepID=A0A1R1XU57_9FUNG|nr:pre-mRNA 3' end processing protein WDR33 [Smittium culicis]OMJ18170.1 pre-mRNA 3' end processing protein WDR33 [Smittium culicis]
MNQSNFEGGTAALRGKNENRDQFDQNNDDGFDGKRMRKHLQRRTVDYYGSIVRGIELEVPIFNKSKGIYGVTTRFVQQAQNKIRCPVNVVRWTPDGRRILTGSSSGEFTLWNGLTFNFETIMQAHDTAIRGMEWSHDSQWLVSGDQGGVIKYWQPNMNNVKIIQAHKEAIRDISFSPSDLKFVTASDDSTIKIWDFNEGLEEVALKAVAWHPVHENIFASGGSEGSLMMWDVSAKDYVHLIPTAHESYVWSIDWHPIGHLLASGSNDHTTRFWARSRPGDCLEKTELGVKPPLPPGAINASSLLHSSSSSKTMQGHCGNSDQDMSQSSSLLRISEHDMKKDTGLSKDSLLHNVLPGISSGTANDSSHKLHSLPHANLPLGVNLDNRPFNINNNSNSQDQALLPGLGNPILSTQKSDNISSANIIPDRNMLHPPHLSHMPPMPPPPPIHPHHLPIFRPQNNGNFLENHIDTPPGSIGNNLNNHNGNIKPLNLPGQGNFQGLNRNIPPNFPPNNTTINPNFNSQNTNHNQFRPPFNQNGNKAPHIINPNFGNNDSSNQNSNFGFNGRNNNEPFVNNYNNRGRPRGQKPRNPY